ncbi:MAG: hypothetical protein WCT40_04110 [Candidatus Magasanikbacteria bacterium]|jgi:hypothetical protein
MSERNRGLYFLSEKYKNPPLHTSPEVDAVVKRKEKVNRHKNKEFVKSEQEGPLLPERLQSDPTTRIEEYLDYLKESLDHNNPRHEEKLSRFKTVLYDKNVIKPDEIPESYFTNQQRIAREQGHGDVEITDEMRRQSAEIIITDQKSSLDNWTDYLSSSDATYPDWLKYWSMRSILGMGEYDKQKKAFTKRAKGTVKPFPDLDREALSYVLDALEKKYGEQQDNNQPQEENDQQWAQLLKGENFAKLYAWAIEKVTPASQEQLTNVQGKWIKYNRGSDHMPLVKSLQGHGTGWCTAGESTAKTQLEGGDFYVFYSLDPQGQPIVPRAAIRMQENNIAEVRGIGPDQNLDPHIGKVVQDKMAEFPDGKLYEKKSQDMQRLTALENKIKKDQEPTRDELRFLYEIDAPIQGFGYNTDPRIAELRALRDPKADAPIAFDYEPDQIAWGQNEIQEDTQAYIGPLFPNIFQKLKHPEYIYTKFPEGRIARSTIEIGGKTKAELEKEMEKQNIQISDYAKFMMNSKDFTTAKKPEPADLIKLKVGDLGFSNNPTTDEIYKKIQEFGLELCPAEVGPHYRLAYTDQPMDEWVNIGMKQISGPDGDPDVFNLRRYGDGVWLIYYWTRPDDQWDPDDQFVFRLRK